MLIALLVITVASTLVVLVLLGLLLVGIRREDRAPELASRPSTLVTALTRHLIGLHVRRPAAAGSVGEDRPKSCPACNSTSHRHGGIV
jgi:hypothetical protein